MNLSNKLSNLSIETELYEDSASSSNASHIAENSITPRSRVHIEGSYTECANAAVSNLDNLSKRVGKSECESCYDDSGSIAMSTTTLTNRSSSSLSCGNESGISTVFYSESEYECNLHTCSTAHLEKLRAPLQSSINWIYSMSKSTPKNNISEDNKSLNSSITSLNKIEPIYQRSTSPSSLSNMSKTQGHNLNNNSGTTSFNDVISNNSTPNKKVVNNLVKYQKNYGVPGGYAKNCLDTFGGLVRKN